MGRRKSGGKGGPALSTMELTILGLTWQRGPCSTYAVMKGLEGAASTYYRSRASTTYSVMKRLADFGLTSEEDGLVKVTERGKEALVKWLAGPLPPEDASHSSDLIRLRCYFLSALSLEERLRLIDSAERELELLEMRCRELVRAHEGIEDFYGGLAMMSAVMESQSRRSWLALIRPLVQNPPEEGQPWADSLLALVPPR